MDDYQISSLKELYEIIKPAMLYKEFDFKRRNYHNVTVSDIWNYLSDFKWKYSKNLHLYQIVDDVFDLTFNDIYEYLKNNVITDYKYSFIDKNIGL